MANSMTTGARPTSVIAAVSAVLTDALRRAVSTGAIAVEGELPPVSVERPKEESHGDAATGVAMRLAKQARMSPRDVAMALVAAIDAPELVESAEVAGPGFVNIRVRPSWFAAQLGGVIAAGETWGDVGIGTGRSAQVEFVSANPTGPVTLGATRGAAVGDAVAHVLAAAGFRVEREYYVNDAGSRMLTFYESCRWYYRRLCGIEEAQPAEQYPAAEHAARLLHGEHGDALADLSVEELGRHGIAVQVAEIRHDLHELGIDFDGWFSEQTLFDNGAVDAMVASLRQEGHVDERDGATWFAATRSGMEKDEVLVRSTGMPTYFMSDIAYHLDKLVTRGFDVAVNVWGADHQGHIPRLRAALRASGVDDTRLHIVVTQLVTVAGTRMKKAHGNYVTLREVLDEVGADPIRFFLISRSTGSTIDFDLDLAVKEGNENPVYYVKMAHARCAGVFRQAEADGIDTAAPDLSLLGADESQLIHLVLELPDVVTAIAGDFEPHRLTFYATALAAAWHRWYHDHRIVDAENRALSAARLHLAAAVRVTLARTLHLMGMSAPDRM